MGVHVRFVRVSFLSFGEKKKKISFLWLSKNLKKKGERDFYARRPKLSSKKVSKGRERFFFSLESENKSLLRRAARWCDDENDEKKKKKKKKTR